MKTGVPLWLVLALFALGGLMLRGCSAASVVPLGPPPKGPDMVRAFATNDNRDEAKAHLHALATIHDALADCLEYDGKQKTPRITTGVQADDLARALRELRMKGWSFGFRYPDLKTELQTWFDSQVGDSGGPLDTDKDGKPSDRRQKWIQAHRAAAACCRYAIERG
jgi:hypothetical protein